jgi:hypothetical protein
MNKIIYAYGHEGHGKFAESVIVRQSKDGSIVVGVTGEPLVDGDYQEPGPSVSIRLPPGQVESLIEALMFAIPQ